MATTSDPTESQDPRGIIAEWYFGEIRRPDAEELLIKKQYNVFLVRTSTTKQGAYAISLYNHSDRSMLHLLVNPTMDGNGYRIENSTDKNIYPTLRELIIQSPVLKPFEPIGKGKGVSPYNGDIPAPPPQTPIQAPYQRDTNNDVPPNRNCIAANEPDYPTLPRPIHQPPSGNRPVIQPTIVQPTSPPQSVPTSTPRSSQDVTETPIPPPRTIAPNDELYLVEGWLLKRSPAYKLVNRWQKRWVSYKMENGLAKILYYKSNGDVKAAGSIDFQVVTGVRRTPPATSEQKHQFQVETVTRVYLFAASSDADMAMWIGHLAKFVDRVFEQRTKQNSIFSTKETDYLLEAWKQADTENRGRIGLKQVSTLVDKLNIKLETKYLKEKFMEVDRDDVKSLDFAGFKAFVDLIRRRQDIEKLFSILTKETNQWTPSQFLNFLVSDQGKTDLTLDDVTFLVRELETDANPERDILTIKGFTAFLSSTTFNGPLNPHKTGAVYQDMTQPMSHYFIASSHNTCLLEGQLTGESSVQAYVNAFRQGCRCVELDCWDGTDGFPKITHGNTLTTAIRFRDVLECIRTYAFENNEYPVILSLDNHCCIQQQEIMAEMIKEVLGDLLPECWQKIYTGERMYEPMPSPESLKRKVLIKGKMISASSADYVEEDDYDDEDVGGKEDRNNSGDLSEIPGKTKVAPGLSNITHFASNIPFRPKGNELPIHYSYEMSSFTENGILKLIQKNPEAVIQRNIRHMSRVYPKASRIQSDNYDPTPSWNHGCQMVALNYQTNDFGMWLNKAKFVDNGGCGYVLKPLELRDQTRNFNPAVLSPTPEIVLKIKVIGAWQLPKVGGQTKGNITNPYVAVGVNGVPGDSAKIFRTSPIKNNGFNPIWNEGSFEFALRSAELAIFKFYIFNSSGRTSIDEPIAHCFLPLSCLLPGYRSLPLSNEKGELEGSSLLCHFAFAVNKQSSKYEEYKGSVMHVRASQSFAAPFTVRGSVDKTV